MCFFKCPFDPIYEKGDSVALAVLSGNIFFAEDSPYSQVNLFVSFKIVFIRFEFSLQDMHDLVSYMLRINPMERPYIYSVIEKANDLIAKLETRV